MSVATAVRESARVSGMLHRLGIAAVNAGASDGDWIDTDGAKELVSYSPIDGGEIARVRLAGAAAYEQVLKTSVETFERWRMEPAPKRGEIVREIGNELRRRKEALGALVSLEMGKILAEGLGEVQEMIDIADFATGLSRQLYGSTMHSERPEHRMYEQWHPLGGVA
jgi:aldehyde dehydrogenase (NAD+)